VQGFYRAVLKLYPAEYRAAFASEMTEAFEEARISSGEGGPLKLILFAAREFAGLVRGLIVEYAAKWAAQDAYITSRCNAGHDSKLPAEVVEVQLRLEKVLRSMESAIAHHDFVKARLYSNEEHMTRALLHRLVNEYKLDKPIVLGNALPSSNGYA
jgi:hypothetical protein